MLELYYGSVEDNNHDWYRYEYPIGKSKIKISNNTNLQKEKGFQLYMKNTKYNEKNKRNRMDLVIGDEEIAISLLIRNVIIIDDKYKGKNISDNNKYGTPNRVLKGMHKNNFSINKKLICINNISELEGKFEKFKNDNYIINTNDLFLLKNDMGENDIQKNKRVQNYKYCGLKGIYENNEWNLSFYMNEYEIPEEIIEIHKYLN